MKLTKQIERLCEKQYRKGFQQGFLASQQKLMTEKQVDIFRANGEKECYSKVVSPTTKQKIVCQKHTAFRDKYAENGRTQTIFI